MITLEDIKKATHKRWKGYYLIKDNNYTDIYNLTNYKKYYVVSEKNDKIEIVKLGD